HLVVADLDGLLLQSPDVRHAKRHEGGDGGDGGRRRDGEVIHHRVRHLARRVTSLARACLARRRRRRRHDLGAGAGDIVRLNKTHLGRHLPLAHRTRRAVHLGHEVVAASRAGAAAAPVKGAAAVVGVRRRAQPEGGRGREQRGLDVAAAGVVGAELVNDAAVEVADGADHVAGSEQLGDPGERDSEEGEEEVDDVLAALRVQHALRLGVDEQL
ncbi:Os01g0154250, partial [Oryza sativa Japonica Group]